MERFKHTLEKLYNREHKGLGPGAFICVYKNESIHSSSKNHCRNMYKELRDPSSNSDVELFIPFLKPLSEGDSSGIVSMLVHL